MTNVELIQKLTQGKDNVEDCLITVDGEELSVPLRPLTSGELAELQTIEKKGFVMKIGVNGKGKRTSTSLNNTDMDINAGEFTQYQNEALYKAVAWSLDATVEEVKGFRPGIPEQLFVHVVRLSNIKDNDLTIIRNFRKE